MMRTYLLKLGELVLKGGNRGSFEQVLMRNLAFKLKGTGAIIIRTQCRYYVHVADDADTATIDAIEYAFNHLFGITGWAETRRVEKDIAAISQCCIDIAKTAYQNGKKTFKIEARRTDKSFPLDSYKLCCTLADAIEPFVPDIKVDVKNPELVISVEIREKAYIYGSENHALYGLPVGTAGRGLLLLSGGIDSPVAGFLIAGRGMGLDAVHFHTYPYTSKEAHEKALKLAGILSGYTMNMKVYSLNFTAIQMRIKEIAPAPWSTIMLRMAMFEASAAVAKQCGAKCLVTGESLSQVASQTIENINCTESILRNSRQVGNIHTRPMPVLRPLIGMDKESIIRIARKIGTYETSILPFEDCCVLFSAEHPILRGNIDEALTIYASLNLDPLLTHCVGAYTCGSGIKGGFLKPVGLQGGIAL
jgi:thiamine biosynthesis protein ThiI